MAQQNGLYCSTAGTFFTDKESLQDHYKSEYHRYNLKRKLAGLPPVTKEWFDARKSQLLGAQAAQEIEERIWFCPLSRKKFSSENTYLAWTKSKKYTELVKKAGGGVFEPIISTVKKDETPSAAPSAPSAPSAPLGFVAKPPVVRHDPAHLLPKPSSTMHNDTMRDNVIREEGTEEEEDEEEGEWETASEEEAAEFYRRRAAGENPEEEEGQEEGGEGGVGTSHPYGDPSTWPEWPLAQCLFCNGQSDSLPTNLDHMWKDHGFYIPDSEYLADIEGLIKYLGLKIAVGHVPLYVRGDDAQGKRFRSTHACQRHMIDCNKCRMIFDDNEDEYDEYYDYTPLHEEMEKKEREKKEKWQLIKGSGASAAAKEEEEAYFSEAGELVVPQPSGSAKVFGSREMLRYYKQRPRIEDGRQSVVINQMVAKYKVLGIETVQTTKSKFEQRAEKHAKNMQNRLQTKMDLRSAKIYDLPQFVPW